MRFGTLLGQHYDSGPIIRVSSSQAATNASQFNPSWRIAARTMPILRSRPAQSGTTVDRRVAGLCYLRCEPPPVRMVSWQPRALQFPFHVAVFHATSTKASLQKTCPDGGTSTPGGRGRPSSAYISSTADRASRTLANASASVSPSVTNSGSTGDVTVKPPSSCGANTRGKRVIILSLYHVTGR